MLYLQYYNNKEMQLCIMNERRAKYMGIYAYHGLEKRRVATSGIEFNGRTNKSKASNVGGVFS